MEFADKWVQDCCWSNIGRINGNIRAVVVSFHGLGATLRQGASELDLALAEENILVIAPYYGPWSWMNRLARKFVDELLERVWKDLKLDDSLPLVSSGGSMGGCSALLYCRYGKRPPVACDALYPVCDVPFHYHERSDLPTTFNYAFYGYPEALADILIEHSPLHQIEKMPRIPYLFIHGFADDRVSKKMHSDAMTAALRNAGCQVEYMEVPGMRHGWDIPLKVHQKRFEFICKSICKKEKVEL